MTLDFTLFAPAPEISWSGIFGGTAPVEVEVGAGKGAFLVEAALRRPDVHFLGIERQPRWVHRIEERLATRNVENARALCADAAIVVERFVPPESVAAYHLYFPDPWWKRRHHRRRLVHAPFARAVHRTLEPGGRLFLATDVADRFDEMMAELSAAPFEVAVGFEAMPPLRPPTNFETKYRAAGRPIHYAALTKRGSRPQAVARDGSGWSSPVPLQNPS